MQIRSPRIHVLAAQNHLLRHQLQRAKKARENRKQNSAPRLPRQLQQPLRSDHHVPVDRSGPCRCYSRSPATAGNRRKKVVETSDRARRTLCRAIHFSDGRTTATAIFRHAAIGQHDIHCDIHHAARRLDTALPAHAQHAPHHDEGESRVHQVRVPLLREQNVEERTQILQRLVEVRVEKKQSGIRRGDARSTTEGQRADEQNLLSPREPGRNGSPPRRDCFCRVGEGFRGPCEVSDRARYGVFLMRCASVCWRSRRSVLRF
mmetsp:Transcript_8013/g.19273  ORF Transcript_8013/g.19273 Transcript_8013/m.19273 type:complete len:262 (-) Transcript_8013:742-1527(-)